MCANNEGCKRLGLDNLPNKFGTFEHNLQICQSYISQAAVVAIGMSVRTDILIDVFGIDGGWYQRVSGVDVLGIRSVIERPSYSQYRRTTAPRLNGCYKTNLIRSVPRQI